MAIRRVVLVCLAVALASCARAPSRLGLNAMNAGDCARAVVILQPAAKSGDGYSINNLGAIQEKGCPEAGIPRDYDAAFLSYLAAARKQVPIAFANAGALLEFGRVSGGRDIQAATGAYEMGARYGDALSIAGLQRLGQPVPPHDLVDPETARRHEFQIDAVLVTLGFAAGLNGVRTPSSLPAAGAMVDQVTQPHTIAPADNGLIGGQACTSDFQCGTNQICVRPSGRYVGKGQCATRVSQSGMPLMSQQTEQPHAINACHFDTECPLTYRCKKVESSDLAGICVK